MQTCALCGHYSTYKNMVHENNFIKTKENRIIDIKSNLNCKNYGIYSAKRLKCKEIYVGQNKHAFNLTWNSHRNNLKRFQKKF